MKEEKFCEIDEKYSLYNKGIGMVFCFLYFTYFTFFIFIFYIYFIFYFIFYIFIKFILNEIKGGRKLLFIEI